MKIKKGYVINKLGDGYVVVAVGDASNDFNGVIRLNAAGAFLWQSIQDGADSRQKLLLAMEERYDDFDEMIAGKDLDEFLENIAFALEE